MAMKFRKSVNLGGGVRLNVNKKSIGVSAGVKGARITANSNGRKTVTVRIPGTGLYSTKAVGKGKPKNANSGGFVAGDYELFNDVAKSRKSASAILRVISPVSFVLCLILTLVMPAFGVAGMVVSAALFLAARKMNKTAAIYDEKSESASQQNNEIDMEE